MSKKISSGREIPKSFEIKLLWVSDLFLVSMFKGYLKAGNNCYSHKFEIIFLIKGRTLFIFITVAQLPVQCQEPFPSTSICLTHSWKLLREKSQGSGDNSYLRKQTSVIFNKYLMRFTFLAVVPLNFPHG